MARPISDLPKIMRNRRVSVEKQFDAGVKRAALAGGSTMARTTRVDTGLARSNYVATLDNPNTEVRPPYAPGIKLGINETANLLGSIDQQRQAMNRYRSKINSAIIIANNVHYIGILNSGGPFVSAGGMLELGVQAALISAKSIKLLDNKVRKT